MAEEITRMEQQHKASISFLQSMQLVHGSLLSMSTSIISIVMSRLGLALS